jgi:hypothetical protein
VMKIDLVGERSWTGDGTQRVCRFAVGLVAFLSGYIAENMDYPYPFYLEFEFP